jgi:predicted Zn-dependent protease
MTLKLIVVSALVLPFLSVVIGCKSVETTESGVVGIDRKQRMLVSEEQVQQSAEVAYQQELQKASQQGTLNTDQAALQRVRAIASRLTAQAGVYRTDAAAWKWEVNTLRSKEANAYAMPGGKIMVYTGLIDRLNLNDDELAAVIGHEIAHALREHGRERISRAYGQQIALGIGAAVLGIDQNATRLANTIADVTFQLPHSREQETEADRMGLELMARAGYDPAAAIAVWRKMAQSASGGPPEFLSTHPTSESRIKDLEANLPKVMPLYRAVSAG